MSFADKVTEERDCSQLRASLYELDEGWDEFPSFGSRPKQNLDHIRFMKDGEPMSGKFELAGSGYVFCVYGGQWQYVFQKHLMEAVR